MKKNHLIKSIVIVIVLVVSPFLLKSYCQVNSFKYYCKDTINVKEEIFISGDTVYFPTKTSLSNIKKNIAFVYKDYDCTKLLSRWELENDSIFIRTQYHKNGQIDEILKMIIPNFNYYYSEKYYLNGQLNYKGYFICDTIQTSKVYWSNGKLKVLFYYYNGGAFGEYKEWYESGQLMAQGQYTEYSYNDFVNKWGYSKELDKWLYFTPNGDIEKEIFYKSEGGKEKEIQYSLNSKKEKEILFYPNGDKQKEIQYNQNGEIEKEIQFEQIKPKFIIDSTMVYRIFTKNDDTTYNVKIVLYSNIGGLCRIVEDIPCDCRIISFEKWKNYGPDINIYNNEIRFMWLVLESRTNIEFGYFINCPTKYNLSTVKKEIKGEIKYLINNETKITLIKNKDD